MDDLITVEAACAVIGGTEKPVSRPTYYRGVKAGLYPAPVHPSPGIARVRKAKLIAMLARAEEPEAA